MKVQTVTGVRVCYVSSKSAICDFVHLSGLYVHDRNPLHWKVKFTVRIFLCVCRLMLIERGFK